ncbi:MAG: tRNA pseudouridine synthase tRNA pseudouridine55 synthase, partial [Candidatus Parcubacteria bacterium]
MEKARFDHPEWKNLPMTYAGRLDPVAEGLLLVLVGDDCKEKDKYLDLNKEYELSILFG